MRCIKCGGKLGSPRYCSGTSPMWVSGCSAKREHLHRICLTCGYNISEPCKDAEPKTETETETKGGAKLARLIQTHGSNRVRRDVDGNIHHSIEFVSRAAPAEAVTEIGHPAYEFRARMSDQARIFLASSVFIVLVVAFAIAMKVLGW